LSISGRKPAGGASLSSAESTVGMTENEDIWYRVGRLEGELWSQKKGSAAAKKRAGWEGGIYSRVDDT